MTHEVFRHVNADITIDLPCKIHIVASHIDLRCRIPFLLFLLERENEDALSFPYINGPILNMRDACNSVFSEFVKIDYVGYVMFNKEAYAFVNIIDCQTSSKLTITNKRWMCLVDEVLNYQKVLDIPVNKSCPEFLFSNADYYTLHVGRTICEIPYVAFMTSTNAKQTEIDHYFGPTKCDYDNYIFESCDELVGKYGIIRYAIFNTTPKTIHGKPSWFVRTLDMVVSLSCHTIC